MIDANIVLVRMQTVVVVGDVVRGVHRVQIARVGQRKQGQEALCYRADAACRNLIVREGLSSLSVFYNDARAREITVAHGLRRDLILVRQSAREAEAFIGSEEKRLVLSVVQLRNQHGAAYAGAANRFQPTAVSPAGQMPWRSVRGSGDTRKGRHEMRWCRSWIL